MEQKSITIGLIIYKHSTRTKSRHLTCEKTVGELRNPWCNKREGDGLISLSHSFA